MAAVTGKAAQHDRRAITVPLTGVSNGISRLLTDDRLARSARPAHTNTSLCKQGSHFGILTCFGLTGRKTLTTAARRPGRSALDMLARRAAVYLYGSDA